MLHKKEELGKILESIDFGSSVAETDELLESARVETSVFTDLLNDKVDLIPGTKGSGKSALYRIFVDFLPDHLLTQRKVVIAHGVQRHGDDLFRAYNDNFEKLNEDEFVNFWCVYLVSLAKEHFIKAPKYAAYLKNCREEIAAFNTACKSARIPDFQNQKSLRDVLGWALTVITSWRPKITYRPPNEVGEFGLNLFGEASGASPTLSSKPETDAQILPQYVHNIKDKLEGMLKKAGLNLWLMIDRLDEIFPRRSSLETRALRALLRTLRIFESQDIRVKIFLRDDILEQVVSDGRGFTALTHVTARASDTLRWDQNQILTMIIKRLYANQTLLGYLKVDPQKLAARSLSE